MHVRTQLFPSYFLLSLTYLQDEDPLIQFYKARVGYFYGGNVDVADFSEIDSVIRAETTRLAAMKTDNRVSDLMGHDHPHMDPPMGLFGAAYFEVVGTFFV